MAKGEELPLLSHALRVLRVTHRCNQSDLAGRLRIAPGTLSAYENGTKDVDRALLYDAAKALRLPLEAVDSLLAEVQFQRELAHVVPADREAGLRRASSPIASAVGKAVEAAVLEGIAQIECHLTVAEERHRAQLLWVRLVARSNEARRALVAESQEFQAWALAELFCHESLRITGESADRAVEFAELGLMVAQLAPGEEGWRARVTGYAWAHVANARRVQGDLQAADRAFHEACALWEKGMASDRGVLNEARVLGLEASLRREQRQFEKALALLDQALAVAGTEETPYLLIGRSRLLGDQGDFEGALEALQRAERSLDPIGEKRLLFVTQANVADLLSLLGRFAEAAQRLPQAWKLAKDVAGDLDRLRLNWIQGRVSAGMQREAEGITALEQVRREFGMLGISYDEALVSLELAALYLKQGDTQRVKVLAQEMTAVFKDADVHREAFAALTLFVAAAEQESATVELTRQVLRYLQDAKRNPDLRFVSPISHAASTIK